MNFFTKPRIIYYLLLTIVAGILSTLYLMGPKWERVLLYFPKSDDTVGVEERYLPRFSEEECAVSLIKELLLGPSDHRFLRFADPQLRLRSCFVRGNALYVDLPAQVLTPDVKVPDFYTVYTLFRKNIAVNCRNISNVYFYIDGVPVYVKNSHD